ncbi:hypothetical protein [Endozoicomonas lisbonensis]|uniref:Lipoprotein n=1 Tax=Endozoicomonas lisbonensis TaxID=3120522 RepID=A0ABV2SB67_9GAMM
MRKITGSMCALFLAMSVTGCATTDSAPSPARNNQSNIPAQVHKINNEMVKVMGLDEAASAKLLQLNLNRHNRFHEINKSDKNDHQKKIARDANFQEFMAGVSEVATPAQLSAWQNRRR